MGRFTESNDLKNLERNRKFLGDPPVFDQK